MITFWYPGHDYDKPNPIRRPCQVAEQKARKIGTAHMVASKMGRHFVEHLHETTVKRHRSRTQAEAV